MSISLDDWACSYSGCDGGDPSSDIWLCGIEWGYEKATEIERQNYYKNILPEEIKAGEHKLNINYNFFTDESLNFPFNLAFAKLYSAVKNGSVSEYKKNEGTILKLNLLPIAFREDNELLWGESLISATGFNAKSDFIAYMNTLNRFVKITENYKPKLIICIGNGYQNNFVKGFFGNNEIKLGYQAIKPESSNKNQNNRYIYYARHIDTLLVVTPFSTSSNGLNSDHLLQAVGNKIRELLANDDNNCV